jgi:succinyl-diaminopimelate desuccinylase
MPGIMPAVEQAIDAEELVWKVGRLVERESCGDGGRTEAAVVAEVLRWCAEDHFDPIVDEVAPGRPNVLLEWRGEGPGPVLLLEAHSDTVPAGDERAWTRPPYRLTQEGDRLYGRGAADTKGNVVAAYLGLRALLRATGGAFPGTLRFLVPVDEEGMMSGIRHYIARGGADDVDAAICCEPEDAQVCIRQKGALRLRAEIRGKMAHGAMPLTGNNPLPVAARFLLALEEEEQQAQETIGFDPYLGWPSLTPTEVKAPIRGASGFNVVPDSTAVSLDVRTVVGQDHDALYGRVAARLSAVVEEANRALTDRVAALRSRLEEPIEPGCFEGRLEKLDERPVTATPPDHPLVRAAVEAVERRLGRPAVLGGVPGATDGTWLWAAGVPIVTTGAGNRFVPHQADEWVSLRQLCDMAVIYADAAYRFLTTARHEREVAR